MKHEKKSWWIVLPDCLTSICSQSLYIKFDFFVTLARKLVIYESKLPIYGLHKPRIRTLWTRLWVYGQALVRLLYQRCTNFGTSVSLACRRGRLQKLCSRKLQLQLSTSYICTKLGAWIIQDRFMPIVSSIKKSLIVTLFFSIFYIVSAPQIPELHFSCFHVRFIHERSK